MSGYLKVDKILNTAGAEIMSFENGAVVFSQYPKNIPGVLQSVQMTDSSVVSYSGGSWHSLPLSMLFTPMSANSKLIITSNISLTNTQTNNWTLYALRIKTGDIYPYSRYVGCHYNQSYMPIETSYQCDSWGTFEQRVEIQVGLHSANTHEYNRKVWDPTPGAVPNTSVLRIMEVLVNE